MVELDRRALSPHHKLHRAESCRVGIGSPPKVWPNTPTVPGARIEAPQWMLLEVSGHLSLQ
jgi:hypothetical protein